VAEHVLVVDTNALWSENSEKPFQHSVKWQTLLLAAEKYPHVVFVVPDVVVHELARHEAQRLKSSRSEGAKALGTARAALTRAGLSFPDLPTVTQIRAVPLENRHHIAHRMRTLLAGAGITVAPIPAIDHAALLAWSLDEHPPFDSTDKGYRDALIWLTVRAIAAAQPDGTSIIFACTDNDFTEKDGDSRVLCHELVGDLNQFTTNTVTTMTSLHAAINELPDEPDLEPDIDDADTADVLAAVIEAACDRLIGEEIAPTYDGPSRIFDYTIPGVENATVVAVIPHIPTMIVDIHERFDGHTVVGDLSVQATVLYQGYVSKADAATAGDRSWSIADADHNRHYALVEGQLQTELAYQFVLNGDDATLDFDTVIVD
jgi:PIN domain